MDILATRYSKILEFDRKAKIGVSSRQVLVLGVFSESPRDSGGRSPPEDSILEKIPSTRRLVVETGQQ
jgi:hypothetical protein